MKNTLLLIFILISWIKSSFAYDMTCIPLWDDQVRHKSRLGVPEKHLPRLFYNGNVPSKDAVVILVHGMFESPYFFKGIAEKFADSGYLVLSLLLPGHWEDNSKSLSNTKYQDWIKEVNMNIEIANCFSTKLIMAGHSLGGLLAVNAALEHPDQVSGLVLWSPALQLNVLPSLGGAIGSLFGLNGNMFTSTQPNQDESPYYSPNAANQINILVSAIYKKFANQNDYPVIGEGYNQNSKILSRQEIFDKIKMPMFLVYTESDPAVSVGEIEELYKQVAGKKDKMLFPASSGIWHGNIVKSSEDVYKITPNDFNHSFQEMSERIMSFLLESGL